MQAVTAEKCDVNPGADVTRILVAEDSCVTQDLLCLILSQRGYNVDIAEDGAVALQYLLANEYDVALIDFHMPNLTGIEVVTAFDEQRDQQNRPQFIAITGDVEGLLSNRHNCEKFDKVLPKPLNIDQVCQSLEDELAQRIETKPKLAFSGLLPK